MNGLIGKKLGMTRLFDETGHNTVVTIIEAGPCYVTEIRSKDKHGYNAIQLGFGEKREKVIAKPQLGHYKKAGVKALRVMKEFRASESDASLKLGAEVKVDIFAEGESVRVTGVSKGKGFAGVVRRHNFSGGPRTHGQSDRHRAPGSVGSSSYPSRVYKGTRMAGRLGGNHVTMKSVKVVKVDSERNLLMVRGSVPGSVKGIVFIKKQAQS